MFAGVAARVCRKCGLEKSIVSFSIDCRTAKPVARCKSCKSSDSRTSQKKNPEFAERNRLSVLERSKTIAGKKWRKEYRSRPEVRERINARMREWQKISPKYTAAFTVRRQEDIRLGRRKARSMAWSAYKSGKIIKTPCEFGHVGTCLGKLEMDHHKGYNPEHWLDVIWLCKRHHTLAALWRRTIPYFTSKNRGNYICDQFMNFGSKTQIGG